jgi:hypothetical protein
MVLALRPLSFMAATRAWKASSGLIGVVSAWTVATPTAAATASAATAPNNLIDRILLFPPGAEAKTDPVPCSIERMFRLRTFCGDAAANASIIRL